MARTWMNLEEALHGDHDVTRKEAIKEAKQHGFEEVDLVNELGDKDEYTARAVMEWLGY
jgi:hypothetical protein